jgi:2,3-diketo-5-methylthio-1-phosphopentane phosphatase
VTSAPTSATGVHVYCDFDGTITTIDGTDLLLERHASAEWRQWEDRWTAGEISSRECLSRQVSLLRADRDAVVALARELPVDPGFVGLAQGCRDRGIPLTIVSDGLDLVVETVLAQLELSGVRYFANELRWDREGAPFLASPHAATVCERGGGTCKCTVTAISSAAKRRSVYVGDGQSDFCIAPKASSVFAKGRLRTYCEQRGIAHRPFDSLTEVAHDLFQEIHVHE